MRNTNADDGPDLVIGGYGASPRRCCKLSDAGGGCVAGWIGYRFLRFGVAGISVVVAVAALAAAVGQTDGRADNYYRCVAKRGKSSLRWGKKLKREVGGKNSFEISRLAFRKKLKEKTRK